MAQRDEEVGQSDDRDDKTGFSRQLNRKVFAQRMHFEQNLVTNACRVCTFVLMLVSYMVCLGTYDDVTLINYVHKQLVVTFDFATAEGIKTPSQMHEYIQFFITASYDMSSALVDANTLNEIDRQRCFSAASNDICRLKYWRPPTNPEEPTYMNLTQMAADRLSEKNYKPSVMDCPGKSNCIDRGKALNPSYTQRTFGLLPEEPIIFQKRMDFPFASVTPLTPVIFHSQAEKVACSGFGNWYNNQVLGAGMCTPNVACDPTKVTSFNDARIAVSGRLQSIFLTYSNLAITCADRSSSRRELEFFDRSWFPGATYEDMENGQKRTAVDFLGGKVFYKFISDVAYGQTPPSGLVYLDSTDACAPRCNGPWDPQASCSDPMVDSDHPMWKETYGETSSAGCSMRRTFNNAYLSSDMGERANPLLTAQTKLIAMATLVMTPQGEGVPDIATVVFVGFGFNQGGEMIVEPSMLSMSETSGWWKWTAIVTCFLSLALMISDTISVFRSGCRLRNLMDENYTAELFNIAICLVTLANALTSLILDELRPTPEQVLQKAFEKNSEEAYFRAFETLLGYINQLMVMKNFGFWLILIQFFRLNWLLALHPSLGILVEVMKQSSHNMLHFFILLFLLVSVLSFLGFFKFGAQKPGYGSMSDALYTNFLMFVGTFDFPASDKVELSYVLYLVTFVWVIFIVLLNFLLAVIVDAYETVVTSLAGTELESSTVITDVVELIKTCVKLKVKRWPSAKTVWSYLVNEGQCETQGPLHIVIVHGDGPAVTGDELFHNLRSSKDSGGRFFTSVKDANEYIEYYLSISSGMLEERTRYLCWPPGMYYRADPDDPEGLKIRTRPPVTEPATVHHIDEVNDLMTSLHKQLDDVKAQVSSLSHSLSAESSEKQTYPEVTSTRAASTAKKMWWHGDGSKTPVADDASKNPSAEDNPVAVAKKLEQLTAAVEHVQQNIASQMTTVAEVRAAALEVNENREIHRVAAAEVKAAVLEVSENREMHRVAAAEALAKEASERANLAQDSLASLTSSETDARRKLAELEEQHAKDLQTIQDLQGRIKEAEFEAKWAENELCDWKNRCQITRSDSMSVQV